MRSLEGVESGRKQRVLEIHGTVRIFAHFLGRRVKNLVNDKKGPNLGIVCMLVVETLVFIWTSTSEALYYTQDGFFHLIGIKLLFFLES